MKEEIEGKITGIGDQGTVIIIYVQTRLEQGLVDCRPVCVRPEVFKEIKKVVGDPVGKRFFSKGNYGYIQDQEAKEGKTGKALSVIKFDDFVIFPSE